MKSANVLGVCLVAITVGGCEAPDPYQSALVPVKGTVTIDGQPLSGGVIAFRPDASTTGFGAWSKIQEDGSYKLVAQRSGKEGVAPGQYKVIIGKRVHEDGSDVDPDDQTPPIVSKTHNVLPPQYSSPVETVLTATVPEKGGSIDFPLLTGRGS